MRVTVSLFLSWLISFNIHGVTIFNDTPHLIEITFEYHALWPRPTYKQVIEEKYLVQAPFHEAEAPNRQREIILHPGQGFNKKQIKSFQFMMRRGSFSWEYIGEIRDLDDYFGVIISENSTNEIVWKKFIVDRFTVTNHMSNEIDMKYSSTVPCKDIIAAKNSQHAIPIAWEEINHRWTTTLHIWLNTVGTKKHCIHLSLEKNPNDYLWQILIVHGDEKNIKFTTTAAFL